jgi:hypothetical protein
MGFGGRKTGRKQESGAHGISLPIGLPTLLHDWKSRQMPCVYWLVAAYVDVATFCHNLPGGDAIFLLLESLRDVAEGCISHQSGR